MKMKKYCYVWWYDENKCGNINIHWWNDYIIGIMYMIIVNDIVDDDNGNNAVHYCT